MGIAFAAAIQGFNELRDAERFLARAAIGKARITAVARLGTRNEPRWLYDLSVRLPDGREVVVAALNPVRRPVPRVGEQVQIISDAGDPPRVQIDDGAALLSEARHRFRIAGIALILAVLQAWVPRLVPRVLPAPSLR